MTRTASSLALAAGLVLAACRPAPLPEKIDHRAFVDDLLISGEAQVLIGDQPTQPRHSPHTRALVEVPPNAFLSYEGRIFTHDDAGVGPVDLTIRVAGEEVTHRRLQSRQSFAIVDGSVALDDYAGRTVEIDLSYDASSSREGTGFYWHRAVVEAHRPTARRSTRQGRNLLFVVVDTLRADHTSLDGYHRPTTPNLEALATNSMVFDRAFTVAPWTLPSTVTLFTGLTPPAHGVIGGGHHLARRFDTLAERLAAGGVTTFGASANPLIGPSLSFDQGFETFSHQPWARAEAISDQFLGWLERAEGHRWFAYLHYIDPHDPYEPPASARRWSDADYEGAYTDPMNFNLFYRTHNWGQEPPHALEPRDLDYLRDSYDDEIRYWDDRFGALVSELDARGLLENTIIIVTSDHGEEFLDHNRVKHGHHLYDEVLRVPLLIFAPGLVEPGRRSDPVSLDGLFRSALQLMRMGPAPRADDLLQPSAERAIFAHSRVQVSPTDAETRYTIGSLRQEPWWLLFEADSDRRRLFRIDDDPGQQHDLAASRPEITRRMSTLLDTWMAAEASGQPVAPPTGVDPETLEQLRSLGYVQ